MTLDATIVSHWQACKRRHALELTWRPPKWRAKVLWEREFRYAIFSLSQGADLEEVIRVHRARFFGQCANPGLDLAPGANSFIVAKDWAMMLEILLRVMKRATLLTLKLTPTAEVDYGIFWKVLCPMDDSGMLHRFISVDRWDEDEIARQLHSWWTFGDMAMAGRPMTLHVFEIGQVRNGRRDSCWTRGYRSRYAPNLPLRFKRPERNPKDWQPEYLADKRGDPQETEKWVDMLLKEELVTRHVRNIPLECPTPEIYQDTMRQVRAIAIEIEEFGDASWRDTAMSRSACDGLAPCPWQDCCYRWPLTDPADAGYIRLDAIPHSVRALGAAEPSSTVQDVPQSGTPSPSHNPDRPGSRAAGTLGSGADI